MMNAYIKYKSFFEVLKTSVSLINSASVSKMWLHTFIEPNRNDRQADILHHNMSKNL